MQAARVGGPERDHGSTREGHASTGTLTACHWNLGLFDFRVTLPASEITAIMMEGAGPADPLCPLACTARHVACRGRK